jgi:hypothetical protein
MKLLSLLTALLLIGLLLKGQLQPATEQNTASTTNSRAVPKVPSAPNHVQGFEQDINQFMQDSAAQRASEIEQSLNP